MTVPKITFDHAIPGTWVEVPDDTIRQRFYNVVTKDGERLGVMIDDKDVRLRDRPNAARYRISQRDDNGVWLDVPALETDYFSVVLAWLGEPADPALAARPSHDDPACECQDCGFVCVMSMLDGIDDVLDRVEAGETMPAGECPVCGALAHLVEEDEPEAAEGELKALRLFVAALSRLMKDGEAFDDGSAFDMPSDDAVEALHNAISEARGMVREWKIEGGQGHDLPDGVDADDLPVAAAPRLSVPYTVEVRVYDGKIAREADAGRAAAAVEAMIEARRDWFLEAVEDQVACETEAPDHPVSALWTACYSQLEAEAKRAATEGWWDAAGANVTLSIEIGG